MLRKLFFLFVLTIFPYSIIASQNSQVIFIYAEDNIDENLSRLCWFVMDNPQIEICQDVPLFGMYAVSPDGAFIAMREDRNGRVRLLDLNSRQIKSFDLCQPIQEFLWDIQYAFSGSLVWSPDGNYLAFTGTEIEGSCGSNNAAVYLYKVETDHLTNLTENISTVRTLLTPASWSPDGEWLALYGAWSEKQTEQGYMAPDWGSVVIKRDGTRFFEIAPNYNTCRLSWSPDMRWMVSETNCFESVGAGSSLILIPFNPEPFTADGKRIDEIISPLRFDWRPDSSWSSNYDFPIWINDHILIVYREIIPISFGYLTSEQVGHYSSQGLVRIDIETYSETVITSKDFDTFMFQLDGWFISKNQDVEQISAFNPLLDKQFNIPLVLIEDFCSASFSLSLEAQGDYIALNTCLPDLTMPKIIVYDTQDFTRIITREGDANTIMRPLGFVKHS